MARKKSRQRRLKASDYVRAIKASKGLLSVAAESLGVSRSAVYWARDNYVSVAEAITEARETTLDMAEGVLFKKAIKQEDTTAIIFLLKCLGKQRGYVERTELSHSGKLDLSYLQTLDDDELDALAAEHGLA